MHLFKTQHINWFDCKLFFRSAHVSLSYKYCNLGLILPLTLPSFQQFLFIKKIKDYYQNNIWSLLSVSKMKLWLKWLKSCAPGAHRHWVCSSVYEMLISLIYTYVHCYEKKGEWADQMLGTFADERSTRTNGWGWDNGLRQDTYRPQIWTCPFQFKLRQKSRLCPSKII